MSRVEISLLRRWPGLKLIALSVAVGIAGGLPLLLYIAFGPRDGNPIGLGLLAVVAIPIACIGMLIGIVKLLVQYFSIRGTDD